jgi:hypothetical protein
LALHVYQVPVPGAFSEQRQASIGPPGPQKENASRYTGWISSFTGILLMRIALSFRPVDIFVLNPNDRQIPSWPGIHPDLKAVKILRACPGPGRIPTRAFEFTPRVGWFILAYLSFYIVTLVM